MPHKSRMRKSESSEQSAQTDRAPTSDINEGKNPWISNSRRSQAHREAV